MNARRLTAAVAVVLFVLSFVGAAAAAPVVGPSHGSSSARGVASAGPIAVPSGHDPRGFASLLAPFPEIPALPGHLGIHPHVGILVTIYPDGTVSSPSLVATSGYNYTLTGPLIGAILDERNNSVLLSGGYSLTEGVGMTFAVQVNDATNVTVDGMTILSPTVGIDVENSSLVNLNVNYVESASSAGILVQESSAVSLSDNDASHSNFGIEVVLSSNVALFGDNVSTTGSAIVGEVVSGFTLEYENTAFSGTGLQAIDVTSLGVYQSNFSRTSSGFFLETVANGFVENDNVSFAGSSAIVLSNGVDVEFCNFTGSQVGLEVVDSTNVYVDNNDFTNALVAGFASLTSSDLDFLSNQVQHAGTYAIDIENCTQVRLSGDNASGFHYTGLRVVSSTGVTSTGDVFDYGTYALSNGTLLRSSSAVTINSDSDQHDSVGILDLGSSSVRVESTNLSFDTNGGVFEGDANIVVTAGTAFADTNGLVFSDTLNGYAYTNNITDAANGIVAEQSPGIDLETNALFNDGNGIVILTCQGPYVVDNSITDSVDGLVLEVSGEAIVRSNSIHHPTGAGLVTQQLSQSFVYQNNISNAATGFVLIQDVGMQLYLNSFFADTTAFVVSQGSGNTVYWNAFIADGPMSYDPSSPSNSTLFDSGYPGGGNYWSNWTTPDAAHGPGQNLAGSDGIVDHPLNITATGKVADHYPLTHILTQAGRTFQFHATGLTGGPLWGIHLLGGLYPYSVNTSGSSITYQSGYAANSSYSYTVYAPSGWIATPSSGAFLFDGTAQNITIAFSPVTYGVTFSESGLPTGTSWNVTVGGVSHGGSASSWVVPLANGTYNFTVGSSAGYTVTPRMGTFTVASAGTTVLVTFTPVVYAVTFTETGLPTGTSWSVVAGGATKTASSPSISFSLANGSYPFSVTNVTGYTTTPGSGVSLVSGGSANWNVVFLAHSSPSTSGSSTSSFTSQPLFWALLAAVVVLALLVALLALMGRRKKPSEVPPAASWSPPGAAGTAGTAAPAMPTPGSGGSEPAWKET